MHRFFVPRSSIDGQEVRFGREQAHQLCHVLRLTAGDTVVVLDNTGAEYDVTLTTATGKEATGRIDARRDAQGEPNVQITLFQSLLARDKFEWVLQKATEVGVARIVPVQTQRSIARAKQIDARKLTRWRRILTEAAEQSHRGRIPEIEEPATWDKTLARLADFDCSLIAATSGDTASLKDALQAGNEPPSSIALLIGPEGGFTPDEVHQARERGAAPISLGPRILRTETAAIITPALILFALGDLQS